MISRFALLLGSLLVVALAAELVLPLFPPHLGTMQRLLYNIDAEGHYALRPNTTIPFAGMFERISPPVTWQVNEQGIRAATRVPDPSQRYRVATYGDSETFGWSVELRDTYQKQMEALDPAVEVLNFGVPGYNVRDIADRITESVPFYKPDLLIYLVNKNDIDVATRISDRVMASDLLLRIRFLYQVLVKKPWRLRDRKSPERLAFLSGQLDRIATYADESQLPLVFAFMKERIMRRARLHAVSGGFVSSAGESGLDRRRIVELEELLDPFPKSDDHLSRDAHFELARRLCAELTGSRTNGCVPANWSAALRPLRAADSVRVTRAAPPS